MKVYTIEEGEYSDYHVVGIFSTKENAEKVLALLKERNQYCCAEVVENPLDPAIEEMNAGLSFYTVCMAKDGTVERCEQEDWTDGNRCWVWDRPNSHHYHKTGDPTYAQAALNMTCWAEDDKHAIKIVNERRLIYIAEGKL